jgi:hypothetical protein
MIASKRMFGVEPTVGFGSSYCLPGHLAAMSAAEVTPLEPPESGRMRVQRLDSATAALPGSGATKRPPWGTHHGAADFVRILVSSAARFGPCVFAPTAFWGAGQDPSHFNKMLQNSSSPILSSGPRPTGPLRQKRAETGHLDQPADRKACERRFPTTRAVQRDSRSRLRVLAV